MKTQLVSKTSIVNEDNYSKQTFDFGDYTAEVWVMNRYACSSPQTRNNYRQMRRKSRISVWTDDNMNVMEHLVNRRRRPHTEWKKFIVPVLEEMGIDTKGMTWNQYAFCTCPCSPGFVLNSTIKQVAGTKYNWECPVDFDITLKSKTIDIPTVNEQQPLDEARLEAAERLIEETMLLTGNGVE